MKIAMISSGFFPVVDGVTVTVWNRLVALSQRGHQVLLLCPDYHPLADVYPDWQTYIGAILPGVTVTPVPSEPFMGLDFERNMSMAAKTKLQQALEQFQPDIIHVDEPDRLFLGTLNYPGVAYARQHAISCVGFFHTNFIEYIDDYVSAPQWVTSILKSISRFLIARNYNSYDVTLTSSHVTQKKLVRMGINNSHCDELLGVALEAFDQELRSDRFFAHAYGLPELDQPVKLLFLGRLTPDKGWSFTLNAFQRLAQVVDLSQVAVIVAGDGPLRKAIAQQLSPIVPHLGFLGRVAPDQVPALLINSDIHVTASEKETRGLTLLEAFAAGICVVAPQAGGVIDSIQPDQTGVLFEPGNVDDFVTKLSCLIHDEPLRHALGQAANASVASLSWDAAVTRLLHIFQQQIDACNR